MFTLKEWDTIIGFVGGYILIGAILACWWNCVFTDWFNKRTDRLYESTSGAERVMEYFLAISRSWTMKLVSDIRARPIVDAAAVLLWPINLPATIITVLHYCRKYLYLSKEDEVNGAEEAVG